MKAGRVTRPGLDSTILGPALLLIGLAAAPAAGEDALSERILDGLRQGRASAGAGPLSRLAALDEVAEQRAATIAALPHADRLGSGEALAPRIRERGIRVERWAVHVDMLRGYVDPAAAFLRVWRRYEQAWTTAMDPRLDRIGLATRRADDGWVVLVALLVAELPAVDDPRELEGRTVSAINEVRREHGLNPLGRSADLDRVARAHSEDMARRQYFAHRSPDGEEVDGRVEVAGLEYSRIAENIQKNQGYRDPVRVAVESWMKSPAHREAILTPDYTRTGVGIATDADGTVYFTQVFLTPRATVQAR